MDGAQLEKKQGQNYSAVNVGKWEKLDQYTVGPKKNPGKLFLLEVLQLTGMEVSLNKLGPGKQVPFYHSHKENEELYLFIKGKGQFQIDGEILDVEEGTVIRVAPEGVRTWRNHSTEDLYYVVIQAKANSLTAYTATDGVIPDKKVEWPEV
ncbi:cupin domain-containing protein [Effusibacillus lacus]|uniref:Cupin n=1 Tax=Effusibacillus lacus TaxID=1348429 RepID=A0A292YT17_9BACL|nr:cupin domain-containing protein [Effusibacillus lacus]TCS74900.1 cupin domain [Effusibacillus lacus]GAX91574.1 cupin [Effusibacillus lacus]